MTPTCGDVLRTLMPVDPLVPCLPRTAWNHLCTPLLSQDRPVALDPNAEDQTSLTGEGRPGAPASPAGSTGPDASVVGGGATGVDTGEAPPTRRRTCPPQAVGGVSFPLGPPRLPFPLQYPRRHGDELTTVCPGVGRPLRRRHPLRHGVPGPGPLRRLPVPVPLRRGPPTEPGSVRPAGNRDPNDTDATLRGPGLKPSTR